MISFGRTLQKFNEDSIKTDADDRLKSYQNDLITASRKEVSDEAEDFEKSLIPSLNSSLE